MGSMSTPIVRSTGLIVSLLLVASTLQTPKAIAAPVRLAEAAPSESASEPAWQAVISDTKDYGVLMPTKPFEIPFPNNTASDFHISPSQPGAIWSNPIDSLTAPFVPTVHFFIAQAPGAHAGSYSFGYATSPSAEPQPSPDSVQRYFDSVRDQLLQREGAHLLREQPLSLDGNPGREIEIEQDDVQPGQSTGQSIIVDRMRLYRIGQRVYQLQVVASSRALVHTPEAERFFHSFRRLSSPPQ
jgi:hypothetical protein